MLYRRNDLLAIAVAGAWCLTSASACGREEAVDVQLSHEGALHGVLVDADGTCVVGREVRLYRRGQMQHRSITNGQGAFRLPCRGGDAVAIATPAANQFVRAWAAGTAPPRAIERVLLVERTDVARGFFPARSPVGEFFRSDRFLFVATIAGAVAIPIAIQANRHESTPGS